MRIACRKFVHFLRRLTNQSNSWPFCKIGKAGQPDQDLWSNKITLRGSEVRRGRWVGWHSQCHRIQVYLEHLCNVDTSVVVLSNHFYCASCCIAAICHSFIGSNTLFSFNISGLRLAHFALTTLHRLRRDVSTNSKAWSMRRQIWFDRKSGCTLEVSPWYFSFKAFLVDSFICPVTM